jgi:hypothetical protein
LKMLYVVNAESFQPNDCWKKFECLSMEKAMAEMVVA